MYLFVWFASLFLPYRITTQNYLIASNEFNYMLSSAPLFFSSYCNFAVRRLVSLCVCASIRNRKSEKIFKREKVNRTYSYYMY